MEDKKDLSEKKPEEKKKETTHIPLRFIRNEGEEIGEEMEEVFNEDKVVHRQGSSQPEAD